jgi:predicted glycosyltransferase
MKRVLISPLNWGVGHATRMIPIIQWLKTRAHVIIGGNGESFLLLKRRFPELESIEIPGIEVRLGNSRWFNFILLAFQIPKFLVAKKREQTWLNKHANQFDIVIADNRYGLTHQNLHCVLVTHQTAPPFPLFKRLGRLIIRGWLNKFSEIWIPDSPKYKLTATFWQKAAKNKEPKLIGWLSALDLADKPIEKYWVLLASGPEPGRTNFVETVKTKTDVVLIVADGMVGQAFNELVAGAEGVIAKCGYSTIMDVLCNNKKALLIPTPGQKEQGLLAENSWLRSQFLIMNWKELKRTTKLNLDNAPTPSNIDMPKLWQQVLIKLLNENN